MYVLEGPRSLSGPCPQPGAAARSCPPALRACSAGPAPALACGEVPCPPARLQLVEAFSPAHSPRRQAWPQTVTSRQMCCCALHGPGAVSGLCMVAVAARSTASPRAAAAVRERDLRDTQHLWSLPAALDCLGEGASWPAAVGHETSSTYYTSLHGHCMAQQRTRL